MMGNAAENLSDVTVINNQRNCTRIFFIYQFNRGGGRNPLIKERGLLSPSSKSDPCCSCYINYTDKKVKGTTSK